MGLTKVYANWKFNNQYLYAWNLADKSSTLEAKAKYIDEFVSSLQSNKEQFAQNNAVFLKTKDNSFDYNLQALISLRDRLDEIKTMPKDSFQYQTAIEQITKQEQGEAFQLMEVIEGCYFLQSFNFLWLWHSLIFILIALIFLITAIIMFSIYYEWNLLY
jgi:hypothetical protein